MSKDCKGVFCKTCGAPFLVWNDNFKQEADDVDEVVHYERAGHTVGVVPSEIVRDLDKWCKCGQEGRA